MDYCYGIIRPEAEGNSCLCRASPSGTSGIQNRMLFREECRHGTALNDAVAYAREYGYTHLLTLDQDSYFLPGVFRDYTAAIQELPGKKKWVIFRQLFYKVSCRLRFIPLPIRVDEVSSAMTSGVPFIRSACSNWKNWAFYGRVVCDGASTASTGGVQRVKDTDGLFQNILLQHDLGYQKKKHRLLGKEVFPNEYPPARTITMCAMAGTSQTLS